MRTPDGRTTGIDGTAVGAERRFFRGVVDRAPGRRKREEVIPLHPPDRSWIGRRWFEMRTGYVTYLAFTFGFANFILILHGLTDWFKDYPIHWFAVAMFAVIVPAAVLIGHRHNRTQQKTETRNLTHLNPYIDLQVPNSKEVFYQAYVAMLLSLMISTTKDPELKKELKELRAALHCYMDGETSTDAMAKEWSGPRPGRGKGRGVSEPAVDGEVQAGGAARPPGTA